MGQMIIDYEIYETKPQSGVRDLKNNVIPSGFIFNQIFSIILPSLRDLIFL